MTPITDSAANSADRFGDRDVVPASVSRKIEEQNIRMKRLLKRIAYPQRGTLDEHMDIFEAAKLIQDTFSLEELGG